MKATCSRCDGAQWVQVQAPYAEHLASKAHDRQEEPQAWAARRASYLNSYYPCPDCNRSMFFRWQAGHLDKDHARSDCADCISAGAAKRTGRRPVASSAQPPPPPEPPEGWDDLDQRPAPEPPPTLYDERKDLE